MPGHLAVVNAGGWGTALSVLLGKAGHEVRLWCRRPALAAEINDQRENRVYLPGVSVPTEVWATASLRDALEDARAVVLVPISKAARDTAQQAASYIPRGTAVLHATKALDFP